MNCAKVVTNARMNIDYYSPSISTDKNFDRYKDIKECKYVRNNFILKIHETTHQHTFDLYEVCRHEVCNLIKTRS